MTFSITTLSRMILSVTIKKHATLIITTLGITATIILWSVLYRVFQNIPFKLSVIMLTVTMLIVVAPIRCKPTFEKLLSEIKV